MSDNTSHRITVDLGENSYPIHIGDSLLQEVQSLLEHHVKADHYFLITDRQVAALYLDHLPEDLKTHTYICEAGESTKSITVYNEICEQFLEQNITRNSAIIALGGGVVGDLAGFVAATLLRGVKYVQIPTTLLAQVDSSVGGKTAINTPFGKNLIGAFYQPKCVIADTACLKTLPARQVVAGYGEVLKYALINDRSFFDWLGGHGKAVLSHDLEALSYVVEKSCHAKAAIVAADERESGQRALLNLGHTFGHACELEAGYDGRLLHGEAVLIGMMMAMEFSVDLGLCPKEDLQMLKAHYQDLSLWPDYQIQSDAAQFLGYMRKDKKNTKDQIVLILMKGIGQSYIARDIPQERLKEFLVHYLNSGEN